MVRHVPHHSLGVEVVVIDAVPDGVGSRVGLQSGGHVGKGGAHGLGDVALEDGGVQGQLAAVQEVPPIRA